MTQNWRAVQLPKKLVDKAEAIAKDPDSNYHNISDFVSSVMREKIEKMGL